MSLTFDDGNADQLTAEATMKSLGLVGTFFITTGWIDQPTYLTTANLQQIAADGNEIGGHTVTHPDLVYLPPAESTRQICNGRVALMNMGFKVTSFAYPFASEDPATEALVKQCGFNSARGLGDAASKDPASATLPAADTIPPANPYVTAAPDEVDSTWTLQNLENQVTHAQTTGGGWVQLTFHHIAVGTDPTLTITPTLFNQFATWLAQQKTAGTVAVKTVDQTVGGTQKPAVQGPAVPPPPPPGTNMIQNPSLETLVNTIPQCWAAGGYGTNTPAFAVVSPGHTGKNAEQLTLTGWVSGDAKLLPALDLGGCSPTGTPGHTYQLKAWYKSTAATQFELYYRIGSGFWKYWTASPLIGAATNWTQATWTTPPLPAGASGISWGLNIQTNGTINTDDYEMYDVAVVPPPPPPPAGGNLVQNPGLETAGSGSFPLCWQAGGYGTNTAVFSTVATAHTGTKAEKLTITGYSSGDAKLLPTMDSSTCAPQAVAGHTYSVRAWYTSTAVTQFALYYRDATGTWVYWTSGPWLAAASAYTQASFTTPALPAGATAVSFGLSLFNNGTVTTDDYAMYDTVGAPPL
ncbi:polysaccharide deacetylase family protein [Arthrobacter sp. AZCC_0090]|uniref:polysaccharide deacetylase family protein n=1 Tax=Arthrobacter sp. AZCC_0090 TaxID=2735881 RepID=UPI0018321BD1|nr:peptidoglycan/xylan/chitin deacetylase (PgdA/CDA1 family) [Arthrobacter sp. AZCC_0090]